MLYLDWMSPEEQVILEDSRRCLLSGHAAYSKWVKFCMRCRRVHARPDLRRSRNVKLPRPKVRGSSWFYKALVFKVGDVPGRFSVKLVPLRRRKPGV